MKTIEFLLPKLGFAKKPKELSWNIGLHPDDDPEYRKLEGDRAGAYQFSESIISMVIFALTVASGYMTFEGVLAERERDMGISFASGLHALIVAFCVTIGLFGGWLVIMTLAPKMRNSFLGLMAYLFAVVFTLWCLCVSSWYNFQGLSGHSALIMYMSDATDKMSRAVDGVTAKASEAKAVLPALESLSASACASHQAEVTQGLGTGGRGVGPYSQALLSVCTSTQKAVENLKATSVRGEEEAVRLGEKLSALKQVVTDSKIDLHEREAQFKKGSAEVEALLRSIRNAGMYAAVEASVATLKSSVLELPTDSGSFGERQRALLKAVAQQVNGAASALEKVLAGMKRGEEVLLERAEHLTLADVSVRYFHRSIPNFALAIGLDLFPLAMMTYLNLASAGKRRRKKVKARFNGFLELDPTVIDHIEGGVAKPAPKTVEPPAPAKPTEPSATAKAPKSKKPKK